MRRRKGFTLVELLVVIGIIAALIAILMPALTKARSQALTVKCGSNLHNMGVALTMYTNQYNAYPGHARFTSGIAACWPTRLRNLMNNDQGVFHCPAQEAGFEWQKVNPNQSAPTAQQPVGIATVADSPYGYNAGEYLLDVFVVPFSYGYNDWGFQPGGQGTVGADQQLGLGGDIDPNRPPMKEVRASKVRKSSDMIAIADNTCDGQWDYNIDPLDNQRPEWPGKIHNKGANVLFCDGHVQWYSQAELVNVGPPGGGTVAQMNMRKLWNNDNESH